MRKNISSNTDQNENISDAIERSNKGWASLESGHHDDAINAFNKSILIDNFFLFYFGRGVAYYELSNYRQAIIDFSKSIELEPERAHSKSYTNRGLAYFQLGIYQQAINDYDKAIALNPKDPDLYMNRSMAYKKLGNHQQAINDYSKAIELDPVDALIYLDRATVYCEINNYQQAIADYSRAIELDPTDSTTFFNRGLAYNELGKYKRAINDFDKAIEIDPEIADYYVERGITNSQHYNFQLALLDYDKAIAFNPEDTISYQYRAEAYFNLGNYQQAILDYSKAIELDPENADIYFKRAETYTKLGWYEQTRIDLDKIIEINPEYTKSSEFIAYLNRNLRREDFGNYPKAIDDYTKAIELDNRNEAAYNNRGVLRQTLGNYPKAMEDYNKAIKLNHSFELAYENRGSLYRLLGNSRQASKDFKKAAKLDNECKQNKKMEVKAMGNQNDINGIDNHNDLPLLKRIIRTQASDPTIKHLCDRINKGRLITQADFQRQYVWKNDAKLKSRLIESVFLEVPIPTIYTAEEEDGSEVVIDGQQRLMTFSNFLNNEFRLSGLEVCKELNHKSFKTLGDIDPSYQEKIENYPLRVIKILKDSDFTVRFDIFERLNRGSVKLNDQELRNCVYRGPFNDFIKNVAKDKDFQILLGSKEKNRMQDVELVLRFFTFYERTYLKFKSPMKNFLTTFMRDYREIDSNKVSEYKKIFKQTVNLIKIVFGEKAFYLYSNKDSISGKYENVINKGLYDVLMNGFIRYDQHQVMPYKDALKEELFWLMNDDEFLDVITGAGTDSKKKLEKKFDIWLISLKTVLGYPEKEPRYFSWAFKKGLWERNPVCSICGQKIEQLDDSEVDHIKFYWRGGNTIPENARLSHRFCNRSRKKKDKPIILRKAQDIEVKSGEIDEIEKSIREKIHFILVMEKNDYWGSLIPDTVRTKVSERIKNEIALHPYEKDKFNNQNEKLNFCDIRDYKKIILNNWRMFEKIFYSRTEIEKHFDNLAEYRNKDRHGRTMDNVTKKGGEAAIEWIGRILESI